MSRDAGRPDISKSREADEEEAAWRSSNHVVSQGDAFRIGATR